MRKRFEQQFVIGRLPIQETEIPTAKRSGALPGLCAALKEIFITPKWNEKIFYILDQQILGSKKKTGRKGMDLWQIFVLSQVRLCQNISYDELHHLANHDSLIRQLMGVESGFGYEKLKFTYQNIIDNVSLLNDYTVRNLNEIIVQFGHDVFKKKEEAVLFLKTDSFVVESNVHFPTDYNLLWDSARKCIDMITKLQQRHVLCGWRKKDNWRRELKNMMRALGRASGSGGKGKRGRMENAARDYLVKAKAFLKKLEGSIIDFPQADVKDVIVVLDLEHFIRLLRKHIDLLERRVLKGESIPHGEKMFSIFEDYTEWINKGKMHPSVELGKRASITTDQFNLVVDYQVMDHQSDSQIVPQLVERITSNYQVWSWSFDKGFWHKNNKALASKKVSNLVMPKKGKCNKKEKEEEKRSIFRRLRNKHSAVESNINELEHRGLNRCPDRGYPNFKRYIGLAVCAYNLRKIGVRLMELQIRKNEAERKQAQTAA